MSEIFSVEIISPEKSIIQTNTFEVVIPSYEGEMGILKGHIALITLLRHGFISEKNDFYDFIVLFFKHNISPTSACS